MRVLVQPLFDQVECIDDKLKINARGKPLDLIRYST